MSTTSTESNRPPSGKGDDPDPRRRRRAAGVRPLVVASLVLLSAVLAGCAGGGSSLPVAQTPAPSSTVVPQPSSPTAAGAGAGKAAPATASGSRAGARATGTGSSSPAGARRTVPFAADTLPDVSTTNAGTPLLVSVTKETPTGYRRYVFGFVNDDPEGHSPLMAVRPPWDVAYVPPAQAVMDGSGEPVRHGPVVLRIHFKASMHPLDGRNSLRRSVGDEDALVFGGDFEGNVNWFLTVPTKTPFRVVYLGAGRVAVDVIT